LLTSVNNFYGITAQYSASRNWGVNSSFGQNSMSEVTGSNKSFSVWQAQVGIKRTLATELDLTGSVEYRQFELSTNTLNRSGYRMTLGLSYSPAALPFGR
jgi:hypothetical protein